MNVQRISYLSAMCLLILWGASATAAEPAADDAAMRFFETKVRPLLVKHCYECHGPDSDTGEAGLRVDSLAGLLQGGDSGPAIIRGEPQRSLLILSVRHEGDVQMPPKKKLAAAEIETLTTWVKQGARWPDAQNVGATPARPSEDRRDWDADAKNFWAFQPPKDPSLPEVKDASWPDSPLDRFILQRLEAARLTPAPRADRRTLLRRASLDLLGLPPTTEEVDAFVSDKAPDAFPRMVDRLLESPRYGERWGRHWLDVVRYADSNGMDDNLAYSDAWRYRDYVIASLNADKPFDRFVQEQLAGDLLARTEPERRDELHIATGFLAIGPKMLAEDDPVKQQMDIVDEQLDTTSRVFMALTMGCVRCHDHKFDPLALGDYYALAGIFKSTQTMLTYRVDSKWNVTALDSPEASLRLEDLEQIIDRHDNALVNGNTNAMSAEERTAHAKLLEAARQEYAAIPKAMAVGEGKTEDLEIFLRGNHLTRGALVPRRFPTILAGSVQPSLPSKESGRLELARWMTSPEHPLTARVIVNRVWRWHFGQGLVRSVDNFGKLGQVPSHPELLDWLTRQFVDDGWSLKKLHKRILLSQTWQMSTAWNEHAAQVDPENRLLWRMPRQRMEAEVLRDSLLAASGGLDLKMGGTQLVSTPFQNLGLEGAARKPELYQSQRRSVYLPVLRSALYDMLQAFDFPDPAMLSGDRGSTTVASQALFMLNGTIVEGASRRMAASLLNSAGGDEARLRIVCRQVYGRDPEVAELEEWREFLKAIQSAESLAGESAETRTLRAWQGLCRVLLSSNEFVYVN